MNPPRGTIKVLFLLGMSVLFVAGCGGGATGPIFVAVSGNVSVDGQPVEKGAITFVSKDESRTAAAPIQNGTYQIPASEGPIPGAQKVSIFAYRKTGKKRKEGRLGMFEDKGTRNPALGKADGPQDEEEQFLPVKFNANSTLTADLKKGSNTNVDFKISAK